jgi:hypothetical protein
MMTASLLDPDHPPFDRVVVTVERKEQTYSREAFMGLPLAARIRLILAGSPRFYLGSDEVEKKTALALG